MTELDLSAEVYPCPKGSLRHRDVVKKIGGKEQFPLLVDASNGVTMRYCKIPVQTVRRRKESFIWTP
jgi:hypothetical protein